MEPLKEMFNLPFYQHFAAIFTDADRNFNTDAFLKDVTENLDKLELNGRLRNTSVTLKKYLSANFNTAIDTLYSAAPKLRRGYTALVLPDFVARYGKEHFDLSIQALKDFTSLGSSEFAIREFLKTDFDKTLKIMQHWAEDKNEHVRRLASEGSRPRLPWSFKMERIIKDPSLTTDILEKLKADEVPYVRKSVANHLNDISKDNPGYMLQLVKTWDGTNAHTRWIIKHASRTLIKKGDQDSLSVFNFEKDVQLHIDNFNISSHHVQLGEGLQIGFAVKSLKDTSQKLVIDYAVHYVKASGEKSKKVFKLKELTLLPGQITQISKRQLFKDMTTRKHYAGTHAIDIIINGKVFGSIEFDLIV
ncbi:3-methyladenine DNA glycosylase AlkC [Pedobacter sp. AK017]|uniref:DNA alkylation repair protein n=1 Tax=Pedobacter sp. AK017 TaxID=2723073 RepID=UPI0016165E21|nr:DNA alkylation repair protein [Pedobacter sp. AK017]MBB5441220.1 3-methyladenine DNA glycosylase AlkC [Pedobacter sp. AK017]